jgi:hypothetical protein
MVRKLSFKDPLLGLANVKWGRGISEVIQADRPARADVRKDLVVKKSKAHTHFT